VQEEVQDEMDMIDVVQDGMEVPGVITDIVRVGEVPMAKDMIQEVHVGVQEEEVLEGIVKLPVQEDEDHHPMGDALARVGVAVYHLEDQVLADLVQISPYR